MVNLFPEMIPEGGKEPAFLSKREALSFVAFADGSAASANSPIRGMIATYNLSAAGTPPVLYVVCGSTLYTTTDQVTWTNLGAINGTDSVSMASSGTEVFIATSAGSGYIVNIATNVRTQITDPDFPGSRFVTYIDGFFVFCTLADQKVWCTALLNGSSIDATSFASAESSPDPVVAVVANNGELWVFGTQTTEVWYNTGAAGFPFAPIQGARLTVGCISGLTVAKMDNTLFWFGQDANGRCFVYRANGYTPEKVSTTAIEWQMQDLAIPGPPFYAVAPEQEPYAFSYQMNGHLFYVLTIPGGASATWVYDVTTGAWHNRTSQGGSRWLVRGCAILSLTNSQYVLVGDLVKNVIYRIASGVYADSDPADPVGATKSIEWTRSWRALPTGANNLTRTAHHSLQLDCETGVGSADLTISLRFSDDGGHTWSTGQSRTATVAAGYGQRLIWRRLGMTMKLRDRVYEVSGSTAAKVIINGAELIMSPTDA